MSNPYRRVHGLIRRRQRGGAWVLVPPLAAAIAAPLLRPVLFAFLDRSDVAAGSADAALRVGLVVLVVMALHAYTDLVRGPDRPVLDPHPVQPRALLGALLWRTIRVRVDVLLAGLIVLSPILVAGQGLAYLAAALFVLGTWLACLGVPYAVYLGSIWAARSPRMAFLLEALRGANAPMHAALIYAPGLVAVAVGLPMVWLVVAVQWAIQGWLPGWFWLGLLPALGLLGWRLALPLAEQYYVRTTALLTEIDGLYAGVSEAEEARHVYLEWVARDSPELLRALRQAGRRLWPYSVGGWTAGALAALGAWARDADGLGWALFLAGGAALAVASMPALLAAGDPPWLDKALGVSPARVAVARALTALLYAQGTVLPMLGAGLIRHGAGILPGVLLVEGLALTGSVLAALGSRYLGPRALYLYGPLALVLWAAGLAGELQLGGLE